MTIEPPPDRYDAIVMVIGGKSDLSAALAIRQAHYVKVIAETYPDATISLHLDGFDDNLRELWDIPEAAQFIQWFADRLHKIGLPANFAARLTPESIRWKAVGLPYAEGAQ